MLRLPRVNYLPSSYQTYRVRFGDTLSGIALHFGTSIYALMIANNIPNPNLIFAGMRLILPVAANQSPASPSYPTATLQMSMPTVTPATPTPRASAPTMTPATVTPKPPTPTLAPIVNGAVSIKNMAFNPRTVTVHVGAKVVWTNDETTGMPHTVTSGTPGAPSGLFDSGTLTPGQSFQFVFNTPGTFVYYCRIHGAAMTGAIVVTP